MTSATLGFFSLSGTLYSAAVINTIGGAVTRVADTAFSVVLALRETFKGFPMRVNWAQLERWLKANSIILSRDYFNNIVYYFGARDDRRPSLVTITITSSILSRPNNRRRTRDLLRATATALQINFTELKSLVQNNSAWIKRPILSPPDWSSLPSPDLSSISMLYSRLPPFDPDARHLFSRALYVHGDSAFRVRTALPRVSLLFATNRVGDTTGEFGGERQADDNLTLGAASVSVPRRHRMGQVERPFQISVFGVTLYQQKEDPDRHFVIKELRILPPAEWADAAAGQRTALVYVHGFNTSFETSLLTAAQICWDMQISEMPVVFSWPSRGGILNYGYDSVSALGSRGAFLKLLELLREAGVERVHIIAHSMGNQVVLEAMARYARPEANFEVGEVVMAAPDIDIKIYKDLAPKVRKHVAGMTLYASGRDKALAASKAIAGQMPRAGDVPPGGPVVLPQIDSIDATALGDDMFALNHGLYGSSRSILNDVSLIVRQGYRPPHARLSELRRVPEGEDEPCHWRYVD